MLITQYRAMLEPNSFERNLLNQLFFEHTVNSKKVLSRSKCLLRNKKHLKKRHNEVVIIKKKRNKDQTVLNESYYINYF